MILKSLFGKSGGRKAIPQEHLPVLHSFVDVAVTGRPARSVSVEDLTGKEIVVGDVLGRAGERGAFVYQTALGRFRFGTSIVAVKDGMTHFQLPSRVESLGGKLRIESASGTKLVIEIPPQKQLRDLVSPT